MREYQDRVFRLCSSFFPDQSLAEDAAQDIFLKVHRVLAGFRGDSLFSTWLYRVAVNHCKDLLRKQNRHRAESWEALLEKNGDRIQRLLLTPDTAGASPERRDLLQAVLSHISPDHRLLLTLRESEGLSYKEMAEALHCSVDSVKARLRRATLILSFVLALTPMRGAVTLNDVLLEDWPAELDDEDTDHTAGALFGEIA